MNWSQLDKTVRKQQRNREAHAPVISLYRWWARRPHAVAGALLDAAQKEFGTESFVVADPFSGGGTVAFEAVRRGLPIYAQDLYRWPSFGLAVCLTRTDRDELKRAADALLQKLAPLREEYSCGANGCRKELTHIVRVRAVDCSHCRSRSFLFRHPFISLASRSAKETSVFFGCTMCGHVTLRRTGAKTFACDGCGVRRRADEKNDIAVNDEFRCWHCRMQFNLREELSRSLIWHPVLVQERDASSKDLRPLLRTIRPGDPVHDKRDRDSLLAEPIVEGLETRHLRRSGFRNWGDVFTDRQVRTITEAMTVIESLDISSPVQERLRLAVLGAVEKAAYLCRWERYHPKAIEAIANHRFARSTVVVETNLMSPVGRGTIPRRLDAVIKALDWMADNMPRKVIHRTTRAKTKQSPDNVLVVTGSSERQLLPDGVVSLVLT